MLGTLAAPSIMEKFVIQGGVPLSGTVVPAGNKNGALPILAASVLTDDEVILRNVPRIRDVQTMLDILERLGVSVEWRRAHDGGVCVGGGGGAAVEGGTDLAAADRGAVL